MTTNIWNVFVLVLSAIQHLMFVVVSEEFKMTAGDINANSAILSFRVSCTLCYHLSEITTSMRRHSLFFQVLNQSVFCYSEENYCPSTRNICISFQRKFDTVSPVSGKKSE